MAANEAQLNGKVISNRYQFRDGVEEGKLFENGNGGACERGIQELDFVSFLPERSAYRCPSRVRNDFGTDRSRVLRTPLDRHLFNESAEKD